MSGCGGDRFTFALALGVGVAFFAVLVAGALVAVASVATASRGATDAVPQSLARRFRRPASAATAVARAAESPGDALKKELVSGAAPCWVRGCGANGD